MRPAEWVLALGLGLLSLQAWSAQIIGEAREIETGELRYVEYHTCSPSGAQCEVEYRDGADKVLARKYIDYSLSLSSPQLLLEDIRGGQTVRVQRDPAENLVVDAGFDHYVRERWQELEAGEEVEFSFLIAGRGNPLAMQAREDTEAECPAERLCLSIGLKNWLLGALVDPISLQYDRRNRRLLQFKGVSNIRDVESRSQHVRIDYQYTPS